MNNIVIHGRLTRDPESKSYTNSKGETGTMVSFSVAVNRRFGEEVDFFNCTCFGKSGEALAKWFRKGDGIVVSGEMQSSKGKKKDTEKITYWNLIVQNWDFAEKKDKDSSTQSSQPTGKPDDTFEQIEEEVPF